MERHGNQRSLPNTALHAAFGAAECLVAADAELAAPCALAVLKVLQHGTTGMHPSALYIDSAFEAILGAACITPRI